MMTFFFFWKTDFILIDQRYSKSKDRERRTRRAVLRRRTRERKSVSSWTEMRAGHAERRKASERDRVRARVNVPSRTCVRAPPRTAPWIRVMGKSIRSRVSKVTVQGVRIRCVGGSALRRSFLFFPETRQTNGFLKSFSETKKRKKRKRKVSRSIRQKLL